MKEEITQLQTQISVLQNKVNALTQVLSARGINNELSQAVKEAIFFDFDVSSSYTQIATDSGGDTVTIGKIPSTFLRTRFNGKAVNIPYFDIT